MLFEIQNKKIQYLVIKFIFMTLLDFFEYAANLKKVKRQGWIDKIQIKNPESVADHSYSMAIIAMIISDLKNCDSEKCLKMVLLHDLAESKIGDYTPEQISKKEKIKLEDKTILEIIENLPKDTGVRYLDIWKEYQEQKTTESMLVHQIDRIEMALQAKIYYQDGYSQENLETFFESAKNEIFDSDLKELFTQIYRKK